MSSYSDHEYVNRVCSHIIDSVDKARTVGRVVVTSSVAAVMSDADMNEFVRRPVFYEDRYPDEFNPKRTPRTTGLLDGQGHRRARVLRCRREERRLGGHHLLPGGQRGPHPVGPPKGPGALAAQHRDDAARRVLPEAAPTGRG